MIQLVDSILATPWMFISTEKAMPDKTAEIIKKVCNTISQPSGDQLLKLLRAMFQGQSSRQLLQAFPTSLIDQAADLGMTQGTMDDLSLTTEGFLVGNVAKEYWNWIDHDREMPPPYPSEQFIAGKDILDVGCSFGRTLWEFQPTARSVLGLEMQQEYIDLGGALATRENVPAPKILQGSAEDLDQYIQPNSMDFVFCRGVFNHLAVNKTLSKVVNILRPGGIVWLDVESFSRVLNNLLKIKGKRKLRNLVFPMFSLFNSIVFMVTGAQLSLRIAGRMHSQHKPVYPSRRCWKATIAKAGLEDFHLVYDSREKFAFWARKP